MIKIKYGLEIKLILFMLQVFCLIIQIITNNNIWLIGSVGLLIPNLIIKV